MYSSVCCRFLVSFVPLSLAKELLVPRKEQGHGPEEQALPILPKLSILSPNPINPFSSDVPAALLQADLAAANISDLTAPIMSRCHLETPSVLPAAPGHTVVVFPPEATTTLPRGPRKRAGAAHNAVQT